MKRFILIVCVTTLVLFSGCTGVTPFNENQTPTELVGDKTDNVGDHADSQQSNTGNSLESVSGTLQIHHIDVGQADATFVRTPINETILIDSGDWRDDGEQVIAYLEQHGVTRIDHLIATHPHADHIGGHEAVIRHFEQELDGVGKIYDSGVTHTSQTYAEYLAAVNDTGNTIFVVDRGDTVPLQSPNVTATVLNPPSSGVDGKHKNSIALQITFGEFEYVTTGDAEQSTEQRLLTQVNETLVEGTVYQAGHHGSRTSSTDEFLAAVDPRIVVISSALDSQYGHPHEGTLQRLAQHNTTTYWTGIHGSIVVRTNGTTVTVTPESRGPTDPVEILEVKQSQREASDHIDRDVLLCCNNRFPMVSGATAGEVHP